MVRNISSSSQFWRQIGTIVGFSVTLSVSLTCGFYYFIYGIDEQFWVALVFSSIIPITASFPVGWFLSKQNLKLSHAYGEIAESKDQLTELAEKLQYEASHDTMTRMLNRSYFFSKMEERIQNRGNNALLLVDADHFKLINDEFGHQQGDVALMQISSILRSFAKRGDLVGRIGGEEFALLLQDKSEAEAMVVAEMIRSEIEQADYQPRPGHSHRLSVSIGVTMVRSFDTGQEMRKTDLALYNAKETGRNRIVAWSKMSDTDKRREKSGPVHLQIAQAG